MSAVVSACGPGPNSTSDGDAHDPAQYGNACAEFYDQIYGAVARNVVTTLIAQAAGGRVLELGSATGRTAFALRAAGLRRYVGVEASMTMIDTMHIKPGGREFDIVHGDFSKCALPGRFDLIFALVSTFQLLPSAQQQAAAFKHLAAHLNPGGTLLLECFDAPAPSARRRSLQHKHLIQTAQGPREYRVTEYPSTPVELDAMAKAAGLGLPIRWVDWHRSPHRGEPWHISLYQRS
jgi:SAM-dependent methyltransferase